MSATSAPSAHPADQAPRAEAAAAIVLPPGLAALQQAVDAQRAAFAAQSHRAGPRRAPNFGAIWTDELYNDAARCIALTGFPPQQLDEWIMLTEDKMRLTHRGREGMYSIGDAVVAFLVLIHSTMSVRFPCTTMALWSPKQLNVVVNRITEPFCNVLLDMHRNRILERRPVALEVPSEYKDLAVDSGIGLVIDATSFPVHRPSGCWHKQRRFYNVLTGCHCERVECTVIGSPPHIAVFWSKPYPGCSNDLAIFRNEHPPLCRLSARSPRGEGCAWRRRLLACAPGLGLQGQTDTQYPRIVLPRSDPADLREYRRIRYYKRRRCVAEQYFGRLKQFCPALATEFRFALESHELWIDLAFLLTNEHIVQHELTHEDGNFYREWVESVGAIVEEQRRRKNERNRRSYHNTQAALRAAQAAQQSAAHTATRIPEEIEHEAQLARESGPQDSDDPPWTAASRNRPGRRRNPGQ